MGSPCSCFSGPPPAVPAEADGLVAAPAELPVVLLRPARLGGRHLDADGRPVLPGARPDPQRNPAWPDHRGQVPADVPVRPAGRRVRRPDGQAAGALRHPDAVRPAGRGLRRHGRHAHHQAADRLPAGRRPRLRQRLRQPGPAELHLRDGVRRRSAERGHPQLGGHEHGPGLRRRARRRDRRRHRPGPVLRLQRGVVRRRAGLAGRHAPGRAVPRQARNQGKAPGPAGPALREADPRAAHPARS